MSKEQHNVVIGKIGRSMYFDRKKWKDAAGNNEAPILYSAIAKLNPQNTYYLIGKSDFGRVSQEIRDEWFPHKNIIDCWAEFNPKEHDPTTWITNVLDGVPIDYGVIHGGMVSLSIPNLIYCLDRKTKKPDYTKLRSPIMSLVNYVSPITYFLNDRKIDWLTITSDGRYMPMQARDMINPEKISLGVRQGVVEIERMKSYEDQETMVKHKVELRYAAAEFQYLLDPKFNSFRHNEDKTRMVGLFFHQYDNKKRIKAIEGIVDAFNDGEIEVFGKWDPSIYYGPKFQGPKTFEELQDILPSIKYTYCYPITPGDISGKWVEAVRAGIIPFFDATYDEKRLLVKYHKIPEWLYINSPEEMREKVYYLESNQAAYYKMKNILVSQVSNFPKNGSSFVNAINKAVKDMKKW
jgi:hypothetical protein